ncbi:hypothetical protein HZH66_007815 [Vespula vulgaris]|uniref:Uncharacterized protein n=1 Tax=Vespula vulgaris TaxID=7454 RepID=A0A834JUH9_VESVU|nr:hypothetical protein HZH66_007815 [Vespula vulgaris]
MPCPRPVLVPPGNRFCKEHGASWWIHKGNKVAFLKRQGKPAPAGSYSSRNRSFRYDDDDDDYDDDNHDDDDDDDDDDDGGGGDSLEMSVYCIAMAKNACFMWIVKSQQNGAAITATPPHVDIAVPT